MKCSDAAIEEYLDKKRFCVALDLAGVAQEIYGKVIRIEGGNDTMSEIANDSFTIYKQNKSSDATLREFKKISSHAKNAFMLLQSGLNRAGKRTGIFRVKKMRYLPICVSEKLS
jgi:hypothetical protein